MSQQNEPKNSGTSTQELIKESVQYLLDELKKQNNYPREFAEVVGRGTTKEGIVLLMANGQYVPANHVCQSCKNILTATDYFDYVCNKCSGAW